ncbi:MAG: SDR family NAD(P)-dependent oxidoreductase [Alphaproteobacteria bacterium]|nr:SDR family NAD(P)-dependent oxidoreductase [Alphaproteobacteria bacterium]
MAAKDQTPIGSGFHAKSTAVEVLSGVELSGKNIIVTGGYSGIGHEMVRALAGAGAKVTVPARRPDVAEKALRGINGVDLASMDLADISSVKNFADVFEASGKPLHILINNAGIMACPETRVGAGWEAQFGVNHLGHMALAQGLLSALRRAQGARVVALSSTAHIITDVHWDDIHFQQQPYEKWSAYGQSKTANALFANALDRRESENGIRAFSVHPGGIFTPLQRHLPEEEMVALGWKNPDGTVPERVRAMFKTPEQGASTAIWAATATKLDGKGGLYCEDCDVARLADENSARWEHVRAWACNEENADRLWGISDAMLVNG